MGGEGDVQSFGFFNIPGHLSGAGQTQHVSIETILDCVCVAVAAALLANSWWRLTIVWNDSERDQKEGCRSRPSTQLEVISNVSRWWLYSLVGVLIPDAMFALDDWRRHVERDVPSSALSSPPEVGEDSSPSLCCCCCRHHRRLLLLFPTVCQSWGSEAGNSCTGSATFLGAERRGSHLCCRRHRRRRFFNGRRRHERLASKEKWRQHVTRRFGRRRRRRRWLLWRRSWLPPWTIRLAAPFYGMERANWWPKMLSSWRCLLSS